MDEPPLLFFFFTNLADFSPRSCASIAGSAKQSALSVRELKLRLRKQERTLRFKQTGKLPCKLGNAVPWLQPTCSGSNKA